MNSGSKMLQVVSILMIVFGAIATVIDLIGLVVVLIAAALGLSPLVVIAYLILCAGGIAELVVGIIGAVNCKDPSKGQMLLVSGVVVAAVTVMGNILMMVGGGDFNIFTLLSGLLFPILFIVGAVQLKNSAGGPGAPMGPGPGAPGQF